MKTIPATLLTDLGKGVVLTSRILKIGPLADGTTYLRFTSIDKDETYDSGDGLGSQTWYAATGAQFSTFEATNDLGVDNAEVQTLLPILPMPGITEDMVVRGELDTAKYIVYEHKVGGPTDTHTIKQSGVLGRVRFEQGLVMIPELRGWTQLLDQTGIISQTCLDCRSKRFGSQSGEEREFCGYDIDGNNEWVDFTVTAVGTETVREFYSDDLTDALYPTDSDGNGYFAPGLVEWTDGGNDGMSQEVESFTGGDSGGEGYVSLRFTTRKVIAVGDTGRIRRDCTRKWSGHNSCDTYSMRPNFRGEPLINIGDSAANSIPGVNATVSTGG